jgi:hypothetical protein
MNVNDVGAVWSAGIALSKYVEYRWGRTIASDDDIKHGMIHGGALGLRHKDVLFLLPSSALPFCILIHTYRCLIWEVVPV